MSHAPQSLPRGRYADDDPPQAARVAPPRDGSRSRRKVAKRRGSRSPWPRGVWAAVLLVLAGAVGIGSGWAYALWSTSAATAGITLHQGAVGFAVTRGAAVPAPPADGTTADPTTTADPATADPTTTTDPATTDPTITWSADGTSVVFTVGSVDAAALVGAAPDADGVFSVAIPFQVTRLTSAGYGLAYEITVTPAGPDTVLGLGGAVPTLYPVADPAGCTTVVPANVIIPTAYPVAVDAAAQPGNTQSTATDNWCLVVAVKPSTYTNTATAEGTNTNGGTEASDPKVDPATWWAYLVPGSAGVISVTATPALTPAKECAP